MKNLLAVLGLICIAPFALAGGLVLLGMLLGLFLILLKLVFIVGGGFVVFLFLACLVTIFMDNYTYDHKYERKTPDTGGAD